MLFSPKPKLESDDTVVCLSARGPKDSSKPSVGATSPLSDLDPEQSPRSSPALSPSAGAFPSPTPFSVAVSIRRGRVLLVTTLAVGLILVLVFTLKHGVKLTDVENNSSSSSTMYKDVLDEYNSYSGNVASAFGKPIEIMVTALVQIITVQLMAHAVTHPTTSWKVWSTTLLASGGISYLISNAFNAANVQLRPQGIEAVIAASDLTLKSQLGQGVLSRTTSVNRTVSEQSERNLITNTVLRNTVLPRVTLKQVRCSWETTRMEGSSDSMIPLPTIDYGFTQRDWHSRLLQEALPPQTMRVIVNSTDTAANKDVKPADLPMDASLAADLFIYAMAVGPGLFPWGEQGAFVNKTIEEPSGEVVEASASYYELLPPTVGSTRAYNEYEQREWFLRESQAAVTRQFEGSTNTSRTDIVMTFSHVDISPHIMFDALSFEVEMDPLLLGAPNPEVNATLYTRVFQARVVDDDDDFPQNCGPWPALCLINKPVYQPRFSSSRFAIDPLQQVHAFGACLNSTGGLQLQKGSLQELSTFSGFLCERASDSAMMVYSVGKRLVADAIDQNVPSAKNDAEDPMPSVITNLRKVYTFTMGRLEWKLEDLSDTFYAKCAHDANCRGLQLPLKNNSLRTDGSPNQTSSVPDQHLVASGVSLPTELLMTPGLLPMFIPRSVPLVEVSEWPYQDIVTGDVLLPHNIKKVKWDNRTITNKACDADVEAMLFTKINNHMYIEHGFQTAYTAATFFLFQNAVVKDSVQLTARKKTLAFDGNTHKMMVWVSTPKQNAYLTLAGCALLVLGLLAAVIKTSGFVSSQRDDPLSTITAPEMIARVMLDDQQFPSMLLHRRVVDTSKTNLQYRKLEQFAITELTVQHQDDSDRLTAME